VSKDVCSRRRRSYSIAIDLLININH
jgi:hypothetical protein